MIATHVTVTNGRWAYSESHSHNRMYATRKYIARPRKQVEALAM